MGSPEPHWYGLGSCRALLSALTVLLVGRSSKVGPRWCIYMHMSDLTYILFRHARIGHCGMLPHPFRSPGHPCRWIQHLGPKQSAIPQPGTSCAPRHQIIAPEPWILCGNEPVRAEMKQSDQTNGCSRTPHVGCDGGKLILHAR